MDELKHIGIQTLLEIWHRRKWLAILCFSAPFALATTIALSLPNLYQATAKVLIGRPEVSDVFVRSSVTGEVETRLQTITQEVLSRSQLLPLITRFNLYPEMRKRAPREAVIEQMRRDIHVEHDRSEVLYGRGPTIAFSLSFRGPDPVSVAVVANTLADMYIQSNLMNRERQATETAEFLKTQLDGLQKKLETEERRIGAFKERYIGELPEQLQANLATLERLNTELRLTKETQTRVLEQMETEALRRQLVESVTPGRTIETSPAENNLERLSTRLAQLRGELVELRSRFSDKYPDVVSVKAEIAALERELTRRENQEDVSNSTPETAPKSSLRIKPRRTEAEATLKRLNEDEEKLRQSIAQYQHRVENTPRREQELKELARDYTTTKEHYETLLKRYEDAKLAETMEQNQKSEQFRILEHATLPIAPSGPNRLKVFLFGFMFSIMLAIGAVVLAEVYDTSFHSLDDLRAFTKVPVLVSIPHLVTTVEEQRKRLVFQASAVAAMLGVALIVVGSYELAQGNETLARLMAWGRS